MKTTTSKSIGLLCLLIVVYACRNQDAQPLKPFSFDALKNLSLPSAKVSAPSPVIVTPSSVTNSAQWSQVVSGIAGIANSGQVSSAVQQAAANMSNALSSAGVDRNNFVRGFTAQVVTNLTTGGTLPVDLQNNVNALAGSQSIQVYLTTFTYPRVNGSEIGPTTVFTPPAGVSNFVLPIAVKPINYAGSDACFKSANDLFDQKINGLENDRTNQVTNTDATYNQAKANAEAEVTDCLSGSLSKYSPLINSAKQELDNVIANLNTALNASRAIDEPTYTLLVALAYFHYSHQIQVYFKVQTADINTCAVTSVAKIAAAKFARDTDVNSINDNFNTTIKMAQQLVLELYDSCHNQGSGS